MQVNPDAIESVNGGVMQFAVVDGRIVFVPLLGFVHIFGRHKYRALHPAPIGLVAQGSGDVGVRRGLGSGARQEQWKQGRGHDCAAEGIPKRRGDKIYFRMRQATAGSIKSESVRQCIHDRPANFVLETEMNSGQTTDKQQQSRLTSRVGRLASAANPAPVTSKPEAEAGTHHIPGRTGPGNKASTPF